MQPCLYIDLLLETPVLDKSDAKDIREYEIMSNGVVILGKRLTNYQGLIGGLPVQTGRSRRQDDTSLDSAVEKNS